MTKKQQIEKCQCGSGKPAHLCCETEKQRAAQLRVIVVSVLAVIAFGGLVALAVTRPSDEVDAQTFTAIEPYSYDPVQNKHFDPDHGHWHQGPPPAGKTGPIVTAPPEVAAVLDTTETIPNPEPWQYDPLTDKHWHAEHGHWHSGRPPVNPGTTTPVVPPTSPPTGQ